MTQADRPSARIWTFFVDRSLGRHKVVNALRSAGAKVEPHDDHFAQNTIDAEWLPKVAAHDWLILTADKRLKKNETELEAIARSGARVFVLAATIQGGDAWASVFVSALPSMQAFASAHAAPFIARVYADGKTKSWWP